MGRMQPERRTMQVLTADAAAYILLEQSHSLRRASETLNQAVEVVVVELSMSLDDIIQSYRSPYKLTAAL